MVGLGMLVLQCGQAIAADVLSLGPKEGAAIPHDLSAVGSDGGAVDFESLTGEAGLILLFVRSTDWCPYCQSQMLAWNDALDRFLALGYRVAAISYDLPERSRVFVARRKIRYPIVSDRGSEIIEAFGIRNTAMRAGSRYDGIPHPFIYVVAPDRTITHRFAESGHRTRPAIETVYQALSSGT